MKLQIPTQPVERLKLYGSVLLEAAHTLIRAGIPLRLVLNRGSGRRFDRLKLEKKAQHENENT